MKGYKRFLDLYTRLTISFDIVSSEFGGLCPPPDPEWRGDSTYERNATCFQSSPTGRSPLRSFGISGR